MNALAEPSRLPTEGTSLIITRPPRSPPRRGVAPGRTPRTVENTDRTLLRPRSALQTSLKNPSVLSLRFCALLSTRVQVFRRPGAKASWLRREELPGPAPTARSGRPALTAPLHPHREVLGKHNSSAFPPRWEIQKITIKTNQAKAQPRRQPWRWRAASSARPDSSVPRQLRGRAPAPRPRHPVPTAPVPPNTTHRARGCGVEGAAPQAPGKEGTALGTLTGRAVQG